MTVQDASYDGDTPPPTADGAPKPRIVVMSDITSASWEPDDMQSFIHLLASADMFEIEGIISTTGWSLDGITALQTHHFYDIGDVTLSAEGSHDPDGDSISYHWSQDTGAGYSGEVTITGANTTVATVQVPSDAAGQDIHIIARAVDDGPHTLSSYRRVILRVTATGS